MKQRCRDLYAINYRLRGLAGKNYWTQEIVSANKKSLGLDLKMGRAGLERCNRSRGFSAKSARHRKEQKNYIFL
jgi:hypothetical protein